MKAFIVSLTLALTSVGCDLGEQPAPEPLSATFTLMDTTGREARTFRSGGNFDFSFAITNTTDQPITYHKGDSGPVASFRILKGDSVVATSLDGYVFLMIAITGHLQPGQSLRESWRAPNTPARNPKIVLQPGSYEARLSFVGFDEVKVKLASPIMFSIAP